MSLLDTAAVTFRPPRDHDTCPTNLKQASDT